MISFLNPMNPEELFENRHLAKSIGAGITLGWKVFAVNSAKHEVRLKRNDEGVEVETDWLPMPSLSTHKTKLWISLREGQKVTLFSPSGDPNLGVIGPQFWTSENEPPVTEEDKVHIQFEDQSYIEYDAAKGEMVIDLKGGAKTLDIRADGGEVKLKATKIILDGDAEIKGKLDVAGDVNGSGEVKDSSGYLSSVRTAYNQHVHPIGSPNTGVTTIPVGVSGG